MSQYLMMHDKPALREPSMLVAFFGWSDAGMAGTGGIRYLTENLPAKQFAELDPEEFYDFTQNRPFTTLTEGGQRTITWPANDFYYWKNESQPKDLLLFIGTEPNLKWRTYCDTIVRLAQDLDARKVIMLGGLLSGSPHTRQPRLTGSSSRPDMRLGLERMGARTSSYQGPTGIGSALWQGCAKLEIPYASIWGHAPHYLQASPNPKVTLALVTKLSQLLDLQISLEPLKAAVAAFDEEVAKAVEKDPEMASYVRRLEEEYDKQETERAQIPEEMPSAEALVKDLEEFLRKKQDEDQGESKPS